MDVPTATRDAAGTGSGSRFAGSAKRLPAMALDLLVIAGWAGGAGVVAWAARLVGVLESPAGLDALAFATLVLPVVVTFAAQEASPRQATYGKRRLGLRVVDAADARLTFRRALGRSVAKFAPWQLAHTAVFSLMADNASMSFLVLSIAAQLLVVVSVMIMTLDPQHRALHDWVAGTRVVEDTT